MSLFAAGIANAQTPTPTPATSGMVQVGTPSGLSFYDAGTEASGTVAATLPTIYGGNAGAVNGCASPVAGSTCDSCAGATTLISCNPTSIHPNLILNVTMQSSTAATFQGTPRLLWRFTDENTGVVHTMVANPSLVVNQQFTAQIKWSDLCQYAGSNATCTTDLLAAKTLNIGIDNNNDGTLDEKIDFNFAFRSVSGLNELTAACPAGLVPNPAVPTEGICDYTVARGDQKVYISDYAAGSNDLSTSNPAVKYNRIAMFYVEGAAATTINSSSPRIVLDLKDNSPSEPSISDQRMTGLKNGVQYCFALGNMDKAGNISYFPKAATLANTAKVCATPDQVVGLLDDKHCFIATATFGSPMAPEVETFRQFRNKFLLDNAAGKFFVKTYYKVGPEAAEWISHSELLRTLSLWFLWPLLLFVKLSLILGLLPAVLIAFASVLVLKRFSVLLWQRRSTVKGDA